MEFDYLDVALEALDKANANLEPELMTVAQAKARMEVYARARRRVDYGLAALARRVDDAAEVARVTGTSVPRAKDTVATGQVMSGSGDLGEALKAGEVSLEQATEIARAEASAPGSAAELVAVAKKESFHALQDKALKTKLEAEQHSGLGERQRAARSARSHRDALGMINVHLTWEPHIGTPIVARAEAEADRLYRRPRKTDGPSPSSAISPTPTPQCCPGAGEAGPGAPRWSCSGATRSPKGDGRT
jgi:hypothetical protein